MLRLSVLNVLIFLGVFVCTLQEKAIVPIGCSYSLCSYTGDPHLVPFSQPNTMYWCKKPGWELLLSNPYVTINVLVDGASSGYAIIDYALVFTGPPACNTVGSSSNAYPCVGLSSPVWTFVWGNTRLYFHKTQCLIIKIVNWGRYFQIYIWQSPPLIRQSCGVCINWNCEREQRNPPINNVIPDICDIFVEAGRAGAISPVDSATIELAKIACSNDLSTSLDIENAKAAAISVLHGGIEPLLDEGNAEGVFEKLEAAEKAAVDIATTRADQILLRAEKICNADRCLGGSVSVPTDPPTKPPTEPPTNPPTRPPTEPPTNPPTRPPTEPPTNPPTKPPTEPPTNPPTSAPTTARTNPPTSAPTTPRTNPPTSAPTTARTNPPTSSGRVTRPINPGPIVVDRLQ